MKSLAFLFIPLTLSWCFSIPVAAQNVALGLEHEHWWKGIVAITPIEGKNDAHLFSISVEKVKPNK